MRRGLVAEVLGTGFFLYVVVGIGIAAISWPQIRASPTLWRSSPPRRPASPNPAVTLSRVFTAASVPAFVTVQLLAGFLAALSATALYPDREIRITVS